MSDSISIYRGDTETLNLNFTDEDSATIDITDWVVFFTVKLKGDTAINDDNAILKKDVTVHDDPLNGKTSIDLTKVDTDIKIGSYEYDIQTKDSNGDITTIVVDTFEIHKDITKRTAI